MILKETDSFIGSNTMNLGWLSIHIKLSKVCMYKQTCNSTPNIKIFCLSTNSKDPDSEMHHFVECHLGLYCLQKFSRIRLARTLIKLLMFNLNTRFFILFSKDSVSIDVTRGVEIVKFSTCPGTSKKPKCTCP